MIGGPRFYERAEIRDVMAYLQVLENPADDLSLRRIVNSPRRGIGSTRIERLALLAQPSGYPLRRPSSTTPMRGLGAASERAVRGLRRAPRRLRRARRETVADAVELVIEASGMRAARGRSARSRAGQAREPAGARRRRPRVRHRAEAAGEEPSLASFLQQVSLVADQDALTRARSAGASR